MKHRIIIENRTDELSDAQVVEGALTVMRQGKVSGSGERAQYCYATTFNGGFALLASKTRGGSDRLVMIKTNS